MSVFNTSVQLYDPVFEAKSLIVFPLQAAEHIVQEHMRPNGNRTCFEQECWRAWLPMVFASVQARMDVAVLEMLTEAIVDEVRRAFETPNGSFI